MNKYSDLLNLCLVFVVLTAFAFKPAISYAAEPAPAFECPIGGELQTIRGDSGTIGRWVEEEKLTKIDRFNFAASLLPFEKEGFVLVLDSVRNRVCRFSSKGVFSGELKLPFKELAIDFAYFPDSKRVYFVFQNSAAIGVVESDLFAPDIRAKSSKLFDSGALLGDKNQLCQKIWALGSGKAGECVLVNFVMGASRNAVFEAGADGALKLMRRLDYSNDVAGLAGHAAFAVCGYENEAPAVWTGDAGSAKTRRVALPSEFKRSSNGYSCRFFSVIGGTAAGDLYLLASFGNSDEMFAATYIYKFDKKGRFAGRADVIDGPRMMTNRHAAVDPSGGVLFMRKDAKARKIQFFRFEASEKN